MCDSLSINHTPAIPLCQATRTSLISVLSLIWRPKIIDSDKRVRGNSVIPFGRGRQTKYRLKMSESIVYLKPFENAKRQGNPGRDIRIALSRSGLIRRLPSRA